MDSISESGIKVMGPVGPTTFTRRPRPVNPARRDQSAALVDGQGGHRQGRAHSRLATFHHRLHRDRGGALGENLHPRVIVAAVADAEPAHRADRPIGARLPAEWELDADQLAHSNGVVGPDPLDHPDAPGALIDQVPELRGVADFGCRTRSRGLTIHADVEIVRRGFRRGGVPQPVAAAKKVVNRQQAGRQVHAALGSLTRRVALGR